MLDTSAISYIHTADLQRHSKRVHNTRTTIDNHIRASDIAREATGQEPRDPRNLSRAARSFQPNDILLDLITLQITRRQLATETPHVETSKTDADINLTRRNGIDPDPRPLQRRDAAPHNAQRRMAAHRECRAPATAVGTRDAADDDDGAIRVLLWRRVGVIALWRCLGHGWWAVLEREERHHAVGFEGLVEIRWCRRGYGRGTQEPGRCYPDVEAAPAVQYVVD